VRHTKYINKDNIDEAITEINKAIGTNPRYALAYFSRGIIYNNKGLYDEAISDFNPF